MIELGEQDGFFVKEIADDIPKGTIVFIKNSFVKLTYNAKIADYIVYGKRILNPNYVRNSPEKLKKVIFLSPH